MSVIDLLNANMLDALEAIGTRRVGAMDIGASGSALRRLVELGLAEADGRRLPMLYWLTDAGLEALGELHRDVTFTPCEQPIERIQRVVAETCGIDVAHMTSNCRVRAIARPRQIAMFLAREATGLSLPSIGKRFGNRDHTTVMYACEHVGSLIEVDCEVRKTVDRARSIIFGDDLPEELEGEERESDASRGSAMLRDAILKSSGYPHNPQKQTFRGELTEERIAA